MGLNNANKGREQLGCCSTHRRLQRHGARSTLASFNQGIQGTKFSFISGHRNLQQVSWTAANHCSSKGLQKGLWWNCTKHDSTHSQVLTGSALWQQDFPAVPSTSWCNPQNVTRCHSCIILTLCNQKGSRTVATKQWKSSFPSSYWAHNVRLKGRLEKKGAKHLKSGEILVLQSRKGKYRINYSKMYFRDNVFCYAVRLVWSRRRKKRLNQ